MIVYKCDQCGDDIGERLRITTDTYGPSEHFCSLPCLLLWAKRTGYAKPEEQLAADDVVDAEIACGDESLAFIPPRECGLPEGHSGPHLTAWDAWVARR
ncbi:hypothetical protein [Mycolicibacterium mucogenicum]|uniref:Uncharacterized protein n=1 Tax=Mycolicibacterium mucogenicum DSM 44124 TaxID=1226753 RepID=A0A8H2J8Y7_MYCMU|nr:hypothetical protein [Mycolicibacterium mucogenicum]KAB7761787.1 hypothetical protein MMUC44124_01105 [Mycolicibacterium mucogenicum DSM 44124]QPG70025.1 hypothetical protein C1S78_003075 [Mycolicibacterium mucogenicum DSM 44124]